jgi:hypothetical protein
VKSNNDVLARYLSSEEKNRALMSFRSTNESCRTYFGHVQQRMTNIFKVHQGRLTITLPHSHRRIREELLSLGQFRPNGRSQCIPAISLVFTKLKISLFDTHREEIDAEGNNVQQEQNESDDPCHIDEIFCSVPRGIQIIVEDKIMCSRSEADSNSSSISSIQ